MLDIKQQLQLKIDQKTKPIGALGVLEQLALQIGTIQNTLSPTLARPTILVFAADHGIARAGVSAYPPEVTYQMVLNFLAGGAAINVFCRQHHIELKVIDAGVNFDFSSHPNLVIHKIAHGTDSFLTGVAMTQTQQKYSFQRAADLVATIFEEGCNVLGFGEMGIGNTSAAALLMSTICDLPIGQCVGRGTGLNDAQMEQKIKILTQAQQFHGKITNPEQALQTFGGFEIAQICGGMLAAFERNMLILVDGFIASTAFLVASKINPQIRQNAVFCHLSDEHGHARLLQYLGAEPLLRLGMRLGEGTGCAVAYPILESAVTFLTQMASFESAAVSDRNN